MSAHKNPNKSTSTLTAAPASSVWVQLYYKGDEKPVGGADIDPIEIDPIPKNAGALKKAVKTQFASTLNTVDANTYAFRLPGWN